MPKVGFLSGNGRQTMTVALDSLSRPRSGRLDVDVRLSCEINYTAVAARRRVSGYVASNVSVLMGGEDPTLVLADRIVWRVPVVLTMPGHGVLGRVGEIDVDVETGEILVTEALLTGIKDHAKRLAVSTTSASRKVS
jgi:hypothetical protein